MGLRRREYPGKGDVHTFHGIREVEKDVPAPRELLNGGPGIKSQPEVAPEFIEHVADADVLRLAEYAISLVRIRDDLRVAARSVQQAWVSATSEGVADLDVRDTVVHTDDRDAEGTGEGACGGAGDAQAGAETGAHRK